MTRRIRLDVPAYAEAWYLARPRATPAEAARALGIGAQTAKGYRARLIARGLLAPLRRRIDLDLARELLEDGALGREVAARLGVRVTSLVAALRRHDLTVSEVRHERVYSATGLARVFGVSDPTMTRWLRRWHADGLIDARPPRKPRGPWRVPAWALMAFFERPEGAPYRARVADPAWRAYLSDLDAPIAPIRNAEVRRWFGAPTREEPRHAAAD